LTGFFIGLAAGLLLVLILVLVFVLVRSDKTLVFVRKSRGAGYKKVMVATVARAFDRRALMLAAGMVEREGILETVYIAEIPMNRPLESESGAELAEGMDALDKSARMVKAAGTRPIPRLERSRLGSKTIVEMQRNEGFDAVVMAINPGKRSEREGRKIAEYVQEHATCTVVVVSGSRELE
jgi:nucleotide-binding universal stress UspA family protein